MPASVRRSVGVPCLPARASRERRRSSSRRLATDLRRLSNPVCWKAGETIVTMAAKVIKPTAAAMTLSGLVRIWTQSIARSLEFEVDHADHHEHAEAHPDGRNAEHQPAAVVDEHRQHVG